MTNAALAVRQLRPSDARLWAVKSYIDLISRDNSLTYGTGLKRLYTLSVGLATFNDADIEAATNKAVKMGMIPFSLHDFMIASILKNCYLYGQILKGMIDERIIAIANGEVQNPVQEVNHNFEAGRREYYTPTSTFLVRVNKALTNVIRSDRRSNPEVTAIQDVANDADFLLTQMTGNEGHITPQAPAWGAIAKVSSGLLNHLCLEADFIVPGSDYRQSARGALKILWFIAKLLYGDLSVRPNQKYLSDVDLDRKIRMSDGTLAAIPFPIPQTLSTFEDSNGETVGVTMKGHVYLSAVAAAAFDRSHSHREG